MLFLSVTDPDAVLDAAAKYISDIYLFFFNIQGCCPYSSVHHLQAEVKQRRSLKKKKSYLLYVRLRADRLVRDRLCSASLISWLASSRDGATEVCPIKLSPVLKGPAVLGQRPRL